MSKRDTNLLLEDILESALKIQRYSSGLDFEGFMNDEKTVDAVIRNFEIIGEAANQIDESYREQNPEIEWNRIRGFRNRIVHEYFGIDYEIVWSIMQEYLNQLIAHIRALLRFGENSDVW